MSLPAHKFERTSVGSEVGEAYTCVPIFSPTSLWRICWDMHLIVLLVYIAIFVPYYIGFGGSNNRGGVLKTFDRYLDIAFLVDIVLSFTTAYVDDESGVMIKSHKQIAKRYIMSYFVVDVVSGIPWEFLPVDASSTTATNFLKLTKISKLFRAIELLRRAKTSNIRVIGARITDFFDIHHQIRRIAFTAVSVAFMAHVNACFFGFVAYGTSNEDDDDSAGTAATDSSWIAFANLEHLSPVEKYVNALYWSVTTITTVGFGDIVPVTILEKLYCIFSVAIGAITYGAVISTFVAAAAASNLKKNQMNQRMDAIVMYMQQKKFPKELFKKCFHYFRHFYRQKSTFDESTILNDLNDKLRVEVSSYMAYSTFYRNNTFNKLEVKYLTVIMLMTKPFRADQDDIIFSKGERGCEMFIIVNGKVRVTFDEDSPTPYSVVLRKNENFGEQSVFLGETHRTYTCVALDITEMLMLSLESVETTLRSIAPGAIDDLRRLVIKKYERIRRDREKTSMSTESNVGADISTPRSSGGSTPVQIGRKIFATISSSIAGATKAGDARVQPERPKWESAADDVSSRPASSASTTKRGDLPMRINSIVDPAIESDASDLNTLSVQELRSMVRSMAARNAHLETTLLRHMKANEERFDWIARTLAAQNPTKDALPTPKKSPLETDEPASKDGDCGANAEF